MAAAKQASHVKPLDPLLMCILLLLLYEGETWNTAYRRNLLDLIYTGCLAEFRSQLESRRSVVTHKQSSKIIRGTVIGLSTVMIGYRPE
jgi:hypothetical protein